MKMRSKLDEADFYKEEVSKLKLIINELSQENETLKKKAADSNQEIILSEDASEVEKLHAAVKTKQRFIESIQQKLKQATEENEKLNEKLLEQD